jgi:uncharacterized protein
MPILKIIFCLSLPEGIITVPNNRSYFRLNVGFIIHQTVGFSSEFLFDLPKVNLDPDLQLTDLTGSARITRTPQGLLVQVKMTSQMESACVRCLTDISNSLDIDFTELYAFTKRSMTESGLLLPEDGHIDLDPLVREYMLLEVPISPLCSNDCKGLCPVCGENLNENDHNHESEVVDPRLSALKSLLDEEDESSQS